MIARTSIFLSLILFCMSAFPGAFGVGSFENDDALDFVDILQDEKDTELIESLFTQVTSSKRYIQAPDCSMVIAAAEVVAAAMGKANENTPSQAKEWASKVSMSETKNIKSLARSAIDQCKNNKASELRELWAESDYFDEWKIEINDLEKRLQ